MTGNGEAGGGRAARQATSAVAEVAGSVLGRAVRAGPQSYERGRDLPGLIRLDPPAAGAETPEALEAILTRLDRALRAERNRARSGHWTYDLNRHIALRQAHLAETERLQALRAGVRPPGA